MRTTGLDDQRVLTSVAEVACRSFADARVAGGGQVAHVVVACLDPTRG